MKLSRLNQEMRAFFADLYEGESKPLVLGEGSENARLALVGEAPGEQEALKGKPFVGKAGRNLDEFLRATGLERSQLYITNVVKIRPTRVSEAGRIVNRPPTREEIALFLPWLKRELAAVKAPVVVTLGNVALKALAGKGYTIGEAHGKLLAAGDMRIFPLYHPASVLYNPRLKEVYEQDLRALRASACQKSLFDTLVDGGASSPATATLHNSQ